MREWIGMQMIVARHHPSSSCAGSINPVPAVISTSIDWLLTRFVHMLMKSWTLALSWQVCQTKGELSWWPGWHYPQTLTGEHLRAPVHTRSSPDTELDPRWGHPNASGGFLPSFSMFGIHCCEGSLGFVFDLIGNTYYVEGKTVCRSAPGFTRIHKRLRYSLNTNF